MEKEFIPYQEALELKQLGFDEPCFTYYKNDQLSDILELVKNSEMTNVNNESDDYISAPTYSQAFRWFREKYGLNSWVTKEHKYKQPFCWYIQDNYSKYNSDFMTDGIHYNTYFKTYEDAELECLQKLIELVKK
jgi:hypothetical protein